MRSMKSLVIKAGRNPEGNHPLRKKVTETEDFK